MPLNKVFNNFNMAFDFSQGTPVTDTPTSGGFDFSQGVTVSQPKQSLADQLWGSIVGYGKNVASTVNKAGQDVNAAFTQPGVSPVEQGINASGAAAGGVINTAGSLIPGGSTALGALGKATGGAVDLAGKGINMIPGVTGAINAHPNIASGVERVATVGQSLGNVANLALGAQGVASAGNAAVNTLKSANSVATGAKAVAGQLPTEPAPPIEGAPAPTTLKIEQLISPKLTAGETKIALAEGRIQPGQAPGLLRDGTPDTVLPSEKVIKAAQTIEAQIPHAHTLTQPELYTALDGKVGELASNLRPVMDATPITDAIVQKITDSWDAVKAKQLDDPYTPSTVNVEKLQTNFEKNFLQASKSDNLGDLWDTRIKYDNSVPANVKNATSISSDVLQAQKSIWLQNRGVLNEAINTATDNLEQSSRQAFSDMSDMYNAQKNIQSSYKVPKEGAPSKVGKFMKGPKGKVIEAGLAGAGALEIGKKVLTGQF